MIYAKKLPDRDTRINLIKTKYINKKLEIIGSFGVFGVLMRSKVETKCLTCNHIWFSNPDHVINGNRGCPQCGRKKTGEHNRKLLLKKSLEYSQKYGNFEVYRKFVRTYTHQTMKFFKPFGNKKIGLGHKANHIDHIRSVQDCFKDRLQPHICGSLVNLQILNWEENLSKYNKSWQTKEEMIKKYNKWIKNNPHYIDLVESLPKFDFSLVMKDESVL